MKRLGLLAALVLCLAGCTHSVTPTPPPAPADWLVTITFSYNFTNFSPCSATVTKGCVSGFTWGYMQGTTAVPLKTSAVSTCSGATQPEACTDNTNALVGIGTVTPYVIVNGIDNAGAVVTSATANGTSQNVAIGAATGVGMTLQ